MKRLASLLVALIFMSGMVMAQNNTAETTQKGDYNVGNVTQQGSDHESYIDQFSPSYTGPNTAIVDQNSGSGNYSDINQGSEQWDVVGGDAYVTQEGSNNENRLNQGNGGNTADVFQKGDGNKLGHYKDFNGFANQKSNNSLDVDQIGDGNMAGVEQRHTNDAKIEQVGDNNESKVAQVSGSPLLNRADVVINGDLNTTETFQWGGENTASTKITGDKNAVSITQGTQFNGVGGNWNGVSNYAKIEVVGNKNSAAYGYNNADVVITQNNENNVVRGLTNKSWKRGVLYYEGDNAEMFTIDQDGEYNIVEGRAGVGYNADEADRLDLNIKQDNMGKGATGWSEGNFARFNTKGADNRIHISQEGLGNSATVNQSR